MGRRTTIFSEIKLSSVTLKKGVEGALRRAPGYGPTECSGPVLQLPKQDFPALSGCAEAQVKFFKTIVGHRVTSRFKNIFKFQV